MLSYKLVPRDLQLGKGSYWLSIHCMSCISYSLKTCCWVNTSIFSLACKNNNSDRTPSDFKLQPSLFYTVYFTYRDKNKWEWVRCLKILNQFENFTPVWKIQTKEEIWTTTNTWRKAFYLGYLWGRSFPPPKKSPASPQKILLSLPCIRNYIEKIIQTRRGQCTWSKFSLSKATIRQRRWSRLKNEMKYHCNISQNCVSKCTRLHLSACSFQNISAGGMPPDPSRNPGILPHLPKPTSHRRCTNRNSSATILKKRITYGESNSCLLRK